MGLVRVSLTIVGEVQGVSYRASAQAAATRLGLAGWVRNCANGDVEAEVEGEAAVVEEFVNWCWKGPPAAWVEEVRSKPSSSTGVLKGFSVVR